LALNSRHGFPPKCRLACGACVDRLRGRHWVGRLGRGARRAPRPKSTLDARPPSTYSHGSFGIARQDCGMTDVMEGVKVKLRRARAHLDNLGAVTGLLESDA